LTELDLSSNNIGERDEEQLQENIEVLLQSYGTSFEALEDHFEEPSDDSDVSKADFVNMIVAAIKKAKVVCSDGIQAKLSACFESTGVIALADAIRDNAALTKVDARENSINDEGKRALRQAAGSRYVRLKFLSFYSNLMALAFYVQDRTSTRR
jgi:hypothetical protein